MKIYSVDFAGLRFPRPRVSMLPMPQLSLAGLALGSRVGALESGPLSLPPKGKFFDFALARFALLAAYRLSGMGVGSGLLAPAYHCRSMIDPAVRVGASVNFYSMTTTLEPNLVSIENAWRRAEHPVRAVLATHFFGRPYDFSALRHWCDQRSIYLIEDASHALFTPYASASGVGGWGDIVVSSPRKFVTGNDGGLLFMPESFEPRYAGKRGKQSIGREIAALKVWARSIIGKRRETPEVNKAIHRAAEIGDDVVPTALEEWAAPGREYQPSHEQERALRISRFAMRFQDYPRLAAKRRSYYSVWLRALSNNNLDACALFPSISPSAIPYAFPLLLTESVRTFSRIKHLGVPVGRWDEMGLSDCELAAEYRLRLIHLPCHQSLTDSEMNWMVNSLIETLSAAVPEN